jgi:hypothetical protein
MPENRFAENLSKRLLLHQLLEELEWVEQAQKSLNGIWPLRLSLKLATSAELDALRMGRGDPEFLAELKRLEAVMETVPLHLDATKALLGIARRDIKRLQDSLRKGGESESES